MRPDAGLRRGEDASLARDKLKNRRRPAARAGQKLDHGSLYLAASPTAMPFSV